MSSLNFEVQSIDNNARAGILHTNHGDIETPIFMPVGTVGSVKALAPDDLLSTNASIILGNTYHLYLRPGDELVARRGGIHKFNSWPKAVLTDSGGFQVFSLTSLMKINKEGVEFRSHLDGSKHFFSPEKVISIQKNLNSDIMMVLDECVPYGADKEYTENSLNITSLWARRSIDAYPSSLRNGHLLFGIIQGGFFKDLRARSVDEICALDFDGFAIGGVSVGESKSEMHEILSYTAPLLPKDKVHYLMGVGTPLDIVYGINVGIDMFDCVFPTRNARNGTLYTSLGKINIKRKEFSEDDGPLDPMCSCYTCRTFSRAYLRHLYVSKELLSFRLNSLHNITYYLKLVADARKAIMENKFSEFLCSIESLYPDEASEARMRLQLL